MAHVRLDRLLREEEPFTDLTVHETIGDELEDLGFACGRFLLEPPDWRLQRNDLTGGLGLETVAPRRGLVEAAGVAEVAREDLLAFYSVHKKWIGWPRGGRAPSMEGSRPHPSGEERSPVGG